MTPSSARRLAPGPAMSTDSDNAAICDEPDSRGRARYRDNLKFAPLQVREWSFSPSPDRETTAFPRRHSARGNHHRVPGTAVGGPGGGHRFSIFCQTAQWPPNCVRDNDSVGRGIVAGHDIPESRMVTAQGLIVVAPVCSLRRSNATRRSDAKRPKLAQGESRDRSSASSSSGLFVAGPSSASGARPSGDVRSFAAQKTSAKPAVQTHAARFTVQNTDERYTPQHRPSSFY